MFLRAVTTLTLLLAFGAAYAEETRLTVLSKQELVSFEAQVNKDFAEGKRYHEISLSDQDTITKTLARMDARWQKADADGKLNNNDTLEMANDQQLVATMLQHAAADSRLVCQEETPMGTRIGKNVCRTVAQIKREQDSSQKSLRDFQDASPRARSGGN